MTNCVGGHIAELGGAAVSFCAEEAARFVQGLLSRNPWGSCCHSPTSAGPRHLWLAAQQGRALS